MSFVLEEQEDKLQEKSVRGRYQRVAVGCWFTASGKAMPQLLKYEDEEGIRRKIDQIQVQKSESKYYAGIRMHRYDCVAEINGRLRQFILLYHPDDNSWDMVVSQE